MKNRYNYHIRYKLYYSDAEHGIDVIAASKREAYDKAIFEIIPAQHGEHPYSAWVASVTYNNGRYKRFNTFEGKAY